MKSRVAGFLASTLLGWCAALASAADSAALPSDRVEVQFRGCDTEGWCRFSMVQPEPSSPMLYRVRPRGVPRSADDPAASVAVRDRLTALLSSMIHQHKRIVLIGARRLEDGSYEATVVVNEADVANDDVIRVNRER